MSVFLKRKRFPMTLLPYIVIDYIQSDGTQYIDTGLMIDQNTKLEMEVQFTTADTTSYIFDAAEFKDGEIVAEKAYCLESSPLRKRILFRYFDTLYQFTDNMTEKKTVVFDKSTITFNGEEFDIPYYEDEPFEPSTSLVILAYGREDGIRYMAHAKLYKFKAYKANVLIRDYIPVQMRESNEVGLWDKINSVFYPNAGTGTFIAGPVISA